MSNVLYLSGSIAIWLQFDRKGKLVAMHVDRLAIKEGRCVIGASWLQARSFAEKRETVLDAEVLHKEASPSTVFYTKSVRDGRHRCNGEHHVHESSVAKAVASQQTAPGIQIELIVDSSREEIETHRLLKSNSPFRHFSNQRALSQQLVNTYPDAIVHSMKKRSGINAVLVQHINFSDLQKQWLDKLVQENITVCSVRTATEVLARFFCVGSKSCLTVSETDGYVKHTYCQSGLALFTRAVSRVAQCDSVSQLDETLNHLSYNKLISRPIAVFAVGVSTEHADAIRQLPLVSELTMAETAFVDSLKSDISINAYLPEACLAGQALLQPIKSKSTNTRHATVLLEKKNKQRLVSRRGRVLVVMALLLLGSWSIGGYELLKSANRAERNQFERTRIKQAIRHYNDQSNQLVDKASIVAESLLVKQSIRKLSAAGPVEILSIVAQPLSELKQLSLQELIWIVSDTSTSVANQGQISLSNVNLRTEFNQETSASDATVMVSGVIDVSLSISEQQALVESFANKISSYPAVYRLRIVDAPIMQVLSDSDASAVGSGGFPGFSIQFNVDREPPGNA